MPTYSLPGATALLTGDDVTGVQTSEIFLSVAPGVTSFSYIMLPEEADPLPPVEIEVDEIAVFERLPDGTTRDVSQADAQFGQIVWVQDGVFNTSYVLLLSNAAQTVVSYYQIGGAALPPLTTVAQFDAFSDTIIFAGAVTSGPFAPGSDIPLAGLIGVTVEDGIAAPGTTGNDTTPGSAGDDDLFGLAGRDRLGGSLGDDTMEGGRDNDTYVVNSAGDLIVGEIGFSQGGGIDTVEVSIDNYVLPTNVELLRLQGTANLTATGNDAPGTLVGNSGNNTLFGRGGNDQINGNDGNDTIIGGVGRDTLVGGTGADVFVFTAVADSRVGQEERDFINGFDHGADRIDLSLIDANPFATGDQGFVFIGSSNFGGLGAATAGQVQSRSYGGNYSIVSIDRDGNGVAEMQIFVNLTATMVEGDFIL